VKPGEWAAVVELHEAAAAGYAAAARSVSRDTAVWDTPLKQGGWSPAQITLHLVLAFEAVRRELDGGAAMALRTTAWQRLLLRFTIQRRLLGGGAFPHGARAPRETRPPVPAEDAALLIARFEQGAADVTARAAESYRARPATRLTHPYFGSMPLPDIIYVSARHIQHHRAQLPG
jgi:hypothetical protein